MATKVITLNDVYEALKKHGPSTPTELGKKLGIKEAAASGRMSPKLLALVQQGKAHRGDRAVYTAI